jgi:hypothetical protein
MLYTRKEEEKKRVFECKEEAKEEEEQNVKINQFQ